MTKLPDPHHPTTEDLFAYRDGELTAERRALIEAHVLACAQCRDRIDEMSTAEAYLRQRPDGAEETYFERMTESVMSKIGASAPVVAAREPVPSRPAPGVPAASRPAGPAPGGPAPAAPRAGAPDVPPVERRRPDYTQVGEGEPRRRFRLPWIGVAGSAAAAVAVIVVAVILFNRQGEWLRAPRPGVLGDQAAQPVGDSALVETGQTAAGTGAASGQPSANRDASGRVLSPEAQRTRGDLARRSGAETGPGGVGAASGTREARDGAAKLRMQTSQQPPGVAMERSAGAPMAAAPQAGSLALDRDAPSEAYAGVLRRHRLPALWSPAVSPDAVARAESDLRFVYQGGRAGADSARIRLYLAEAERARLDPSNTDAVESISHHYRRAISLAHGDAALAATARKRLTEFEEEMIRARGTQP